MSIEVYVHLEQFWAPHTRWNWFVPSTAVILGEWWHALVHYKINRSYFIY